MIYRKLLKNGVLNMHSEIPMIFAFLSDEIRYSVSDRYKYKNIYFRKLG